MAIDCCPECNRGISAGVAACPHCGFPMSHGLPRFWHAQFGNLWRLLTCVGAEVLETAKATVEQVVRLTRYAAGLWQSRRHVRQLAVVKSRFGERVYRLNRGDPARRNDVGRIESRIAAIKAVGGSTSLLEGCRRESLSRLAESAAEDLADELQPEYQAVRAEQEVHDRHAAQVRRAREGLELANGIARRRVWVGSSTVAVIFLALTVWLAGQGASVSQEEEWLAAEKRLPKSIKPSTIEIPVLVVRESEQVGSLANIRMSLQRSNDRNQPPRIAIAEDTPGGSGSTLRSSVWLAAMVAALARNDDLSGVEATFSVPGMVDGPSAGAVICLALLSALDGKPLPPDLAFTGSILPDGTVGQVDGIVQKIRAAKEGGAQRVMVPAYVRFQEDLATGQLVDLKLLAGSLGLQFIQVENIEQAYQVVHGMGPVLRPPFDASVTDLSSDVEAHLAHRIAASLEAGDAILKSLPDSEREQLLGGPYAAELSRFRAGADQAYRSGRLFYAYDCATQWAGIFRALERAKEVFTNMQPDRLKGRDELINSCDSAIAQIFTSSPDSMTLAEELSQRMPPIASQFCMDIRALHSTKSMVGAFDLALEAQLAETSKSPAGVATSVRDAELQALGTISQYKGLQLLIAYAAKDGLEGYPEEVAGLSNTIAQVPLDTDRMLQVERLFYTAYASAHQVLETNIIEAVAAENGGSRQTAYATLMQADSSFAGHVPLPALAAQAHEKVQRLARDGKANGFLTALNAQCCANHLADIAGIVVRWTELDAELQADGGIVYGRVSVLAYMLRTARENALLNIARCQRTGISCPAAIYHFERAECTRDDPSEDKVNALVSYWQASLQAQALRMLFRGALRSK